MKNLRHWLYGVLALTGGILGGAIASRVMPADSLAIAATHGMRAMKEVRAQKFVLTGADGTERGIDSGDLARYRRRSNSMTPRAATAPNFASATKAPRPSPSLMKLASSAFSSAPARPAAMDLRSSPPMAASSPASPWPKTISQA